MKKENSKNNNKWNKNGKLYKLNQIKKRNRKRLEKNNYCKSKFKKKNKTDLNQNRKSMKKKNNYRWSRNNKIFNQLWVIIFNRI